MTLALYEKLVQRRDEAQSHFEAAWLALTRTPEYQESLARRADSFEASMEVSAARQKLPKAVQYRMENERRAAQMLDNKQDREMRDAKNGGTP